ncbi:Hypp153 [Branchiostoma lanceolatum]|uniref:Hypp153 protein n=1 Tax=Branchiostoma lanceolatum TaxID=7740 RepID=A0A8J9W1T9_BRALA|nr:Hypp153 [Branchiostoma lanceolatum]
MQDEASALNLENDELKRMVAELKGILIEVRSENLRLRSQCEKQTRDITVACKTDEEKERAWKLLTEDHNLLKKKYEKMSVDMETMGKEKEQSESNIQQLCRQLKEIESKNLLLNEQTKAAGKTHEEMEQAWKLLVEDHNLLKKEYEKMSAVMETTVKEKEQIESKVQQLCRLEEVESKNLKRHEQTKAAGKTHEERERAWELLTEDHNLLKKKYERMSAVMETTVKEKEQSKSDVLHLCRQLKEMESKNMKIHEQKNATGQTHEEMERDWKLLVEDHNLLKKKYEKMSAVMETTVKEKEQSQSDVLQLCRQLKEMESKNLQLHEQTKRARSLASLSEEGYLHGQRGNRAEATYNQNGEQQGICNSPVVHRLSRSRERVIEHSRRLMRARSASSLAESDDEQNIDKSEDGIYLNTRRSRSTDVNQNGPIHRAQSLMSPSEADCSHKEQLGESSPRVTRHISRSRERIQHNRTLMRSRSSSSLAASDDEQNNNMENKEESNLHVRNNQRTDVNQNRWNISGVEEEHAKAAQRYKEEINKLKAQLTETQDENRSLQTLTNKMKREDGLLQKTKEELQKVLTEKKQLQQAHARFELELTQYRKNAELQNNARNNDNSHEELGHLSEMIVSDELMKCKEDPETESQETGRGTLDYTNALESKLREANRLLKGANEQVEKLDEERRNLLLECKMQSQLLQQSEDKLRQLQDENRGLKEEVKKAASVPATGGLVIQDMKTKDVAMEELRSLHEMQDKAFTSELETDKLRRIVQELKDSHIKMRSENLSLQSKCEKQTKEIAEVLKTYKEKEQTWKKEIEQLMLQEAEQAPSGEKYNKIIAENMDKKREQSRTKIQQKEMEANIESSNLDLHQQIGEKDREIVKTTEERKEKTEEEEEMVYKSSENAFSQTRIELQKSEPTMRGHKGTYADLNSDHIKKLDEERRNLQLQCDMHSQQLQQSNDHMSLLQAENRSLKEDVVSMVRRLQQDNGKGSMITKEIGTTDLKTIKENLWGAITDLDQEKKRVELEVTRQKMLRQEAERRVDVLKKEICRLELILDSTQSVDVAEKVPHMSIPTTESMQTEQELQVTKQNLARAIADNEALRQKHENANEEISQLKLNLHKLKEELHTSDFETGKGSKFVQELKESHLAIRSENLRLQRECQKLVSTIQSHESSVRDLKEERDRLQKLTEEHPLLKNRPDKGSEIVPTMTEEKSAEILKSKTHATAMNTTIQDAENLVDTVNVETSFKRSLKQTQEKVSESELETDKLRRMVQDLKDRHIEMRSENLHLQSKCEKLTKELASEVKSREDSQHDRKKPSQKVENFVENNFEHKRMLANMCAVVLTQENEHSKMKVEQLYTQLKEMESSFAAIKRDNIKLGKQQESREKGTRITNQQENAESELESERLKRMIEELKETLIKSRSENLRPHRECEKQTNERELAVKSCEQKEQTWQKESDKLHLGIEAHTLLKEKHESICAIVESVTKEKEESVSKVQQLQIQLTERDTNIAEIQSENLKLHQEIKEKDSDITKITEELTKKKEETETLSEQCRTLESALNQTRLELQLSESQVQEVKHKLASEQDGREGTITKLNQELKENAQKAEERYRKMSTLLDNIYQEKLAWELEVRRLKEVETTLARLETTNSMLEQTIQDRESTITEVRQKMEVNARKAEERYEKISATLDNVYQEKAALETEVQELKEKERQLKEMETKNYMLGKRIKERESTITKLKEELKENAQKAVEKYKKMSAISDNIYQERLTLEIEVQRLRKVETTLNTFKTKNSKLEQRIKERESTISKVKQELEDNAREAEEADTRYKSVEDKLNQNLKLVEEMKTEKQEDKIRLEQAEASMKSMREELEEKLHMIETELTQTQCSKSDVVQKLKEVEESNKDAENDKWSEKSKQDAENDKCKLRSELKELQDKFHQNLKLVDEMKTEKEKDKQALLATEASMKSTREELEGKLRRSERSKQDAEDDKCKLRSELKELQDRVSGSSSELERLKLFVKELEDTNVSIRTDNLRLERQCTAYSTVKSKLEELQERVSTSTSRLAEQETFVKELKGEKDDLLQTLKEAEKMKQNAEKDKCKLELELKEMQGRVSGSTSRLAEQETFVKELKSEKNDLLQKLKETEKMKQNAEKDKCKLELELKDMQGRVSGSTSRLAEQEMMVKELKGERDDIVRKLKEAEKSKQNAEEDRCRFKRELEQLKESVGNNPLELEKLKMLVKELKDTNISIRTDNLRLERQCNNYGSELETTVKACEDRERHLVKRNAELEKEVEELHCMRDKHSELCDTVQEKVVIENKYKEATAQLVAMEKKEMEIKAQNLKLEEKISEIESQTLTLEKKINDKEMEIKNLTEELNEYTIRCKDMEEQLRRRSWEVDYAKTVSDVKKEQQHIMEKKLAEGDSTRAKCITKLENKVDSLQISLTEKMGEVSDLTEKLAEAENERALAESERSQVEQCLQVTQLKLALAEDELAGVSKEKRHLSRQVKFLENTKDQAERKAKQFKLQVAKMQKDSYESEREKEELKDIVSEKVWQLTLMLDEKEKIEDTVLKAKQELSDLIKMGTQTRQVDGAEVVVPERNDNNELTQTPVQKS